MSTYFFKKGVNFIKTNKKFILSQKAHSRLGAMHHKLKTKRNKRLGNYHNYVYNEQQALNRLLTQKEKKEIYDFWMDGLK